ncbi:hypothetical protein EYR40_004094 [Pleurotus pulmonarius]|nr:hypothetical protein EYR40_004094 [Pleurotus pulmonarius]KAF4606798.1 hypothetical protein EYR38_000853 [Pleurotus pulmonarius]
MSRYGNRYSNSRTGAPVRRQPSLVSNVSGIADSTISFNTLVTGESLQLSQFPQPPRFTPLSPVQSESGSFTTRSSGRRDDGRSIYSMSPSMVSERDRGSPLTQSPVPPVPSLPSHPGLSSLRGGDTASAISQSSRTLSPYDWHEGASSIDVDGADERMLPTSFITQLLREHPEPNSRFNRHVSSNSDGFSGFSELTYPPPPHRQPLPSPRGPLPRPTGGRPSPSSPHLHRTGSQSDSDTLITSVGDDHSRPLGRAHGPPGTRQAPPSSYPMSSGKDRAWEDFSEADEDLKGYKYADQSNSGRGNGTPTPQPNFDPRGHAQRENRKSISGRSFVSSLISRSPSTSSRSIRSFRRAFDWMRKPLPPVPVIPPKYTQPTQPIPRNYEEDLALPDLITRADTLSNLLEKGYHPHRSLTSSFFTQGDLNYQHQGLTSGFDDSRVDVMNLAHRNQTHQKDTLDFRSAVPDGDQDPPSGGHFFTRKRIWFLVALVLIALVAVAVTLGVVLSRKQSGSALPSCSGNLTGSTCDLDATCVCTSSSQPCLPLAQHLVSLHPTMNQLFNTNYTLNSLALSLWLAQGDPRGGNCASQAMLVDVSPSLSGSHPNRTAWAQSALLWNVAESEDLDTVEKMRNFVIKAPWKDLESSDGPINSAGSSFSTTGSGFLFDFAAQTVAPAASVSFNDGGQPTEAQRQRVGTVAQAVLDRMYTFSSAASTQKTKALENYWINVLQQTSSDLAVFLSVLSTSPILLPFNAVTSGEGSVISLLPDATSFPPPIACYPRLTTAQTRNINLLETSVFNLPPVTSPSSFQSSCFPDRPVYGVLDVLRLRLPFLDSRTGDIARQAVVLKQETSPRVVAYTNEALAALPFGDGVSPNTNPLNYGALNNFKHVVFRYLSSIPDVNVAIDFARFVLSRVATPPSNNTSPQLLAALSRLPPMEVAVFGAITTDDIDSVLSSFGSPSGSLFFGSDEALAVRQWIIGAGRSVAWTETATSQLIVRDSSFTDSVFNQTWSAAAARLNDAKVADVVASFTSTTKFTPQ